MTPRNDSTVCPGLSHLAGSYWGSISWRPWPKPPSRRSCRGGDGWSSRGRRSRRSCRPNTPPVRSGNKSERCKMNKLSSSFPDCCVRNVDFFFLRPRPHFLSRLSRWRHQARVGSVAPQRQEGAQRGSDLPGRQQHQRRGGGQQVGRPHRGSCRTCTQNRSGPRSRLAGFLLTLRCMRNFHQSDISANNFFSLCDLIPSRSVFIAECSWLCSFRVHVGHTVRPPSFCSAH